MSELKPYPFFWLLILKNWFHHVAGNKYCLYKVSNGTKTLPNKKDMGMKFG